MRVAPNDSRLPVVLSYFVRATSPSGRGIQRLVRVVQAGSSSRSAPPVPVTSAPPATTPAVTPPTTSGVSVATAALPGATVSVPYTVTLAATGGTSPYTWSLASGTLPAGLTLSAAGVIAGTPTAAGTSAFHRHRARLRRRDRDREPLDRSSPRPRSRRRTRRARTGRATSIAAARSRPSRARSTCRASPRARPRPTPPSGSGSTVRKEPSSPLIQAGADESYDPASGAVTTSLWWEILPAACEA